MTTYNEIIYLILDLIKGNSDDFYLNEHHIAFLLNKYKGSLLTQKYSKDYSKIDPSNFQNICISLSKDSDCEDIILKSSSPIPPYIGELSIYTPPFNKVIYVSNDRFKYTGSGKFGQRMIYSTLLPNRMLYIKSRNHQLSYLKSITVSGVFLELIPNSLSCDNSSKDNECLDIYDTPFVIEEGLFPMLIQMVLNDLLQSAYRSPDRFNNGRDDLPDIYSLSQAIARALRNKGNKDEDN